MREVFNKYSDMFVHNEYYDKYVQLCECDESVVEITQIHHIIPKSYFKFVQQNVENDECNLVRLSFKNHILAHYYLYFCVSNDFYQVKNSSAIMVFLNTGICVHKDSKIDFEKEIDSKDWDEIYKCAKNSIGDNYKNTTYVNDGTSYFRIPNDQLQYYLSIGFNKGSIRNVIQITNGVDSKYVKKDELDSYTQSGWRIGHSHITSQKIKGYKKIHLGDREKMVSQDDLQYYIDQGWSLGRSEVAKQNQKNNMRPTRYKGTRGIYKGNATGYLWVTNGSEMKRIHKDKLDQFLLQNSDWKLGQVGYIWVNDGNRNIRVRSLKQAQELINSGMYFGMVKRKKQ